MYIDEQLIVVIYLVFSCIWSFAIAASKELHCEEHLEYSTQDSLEAKNKTIQLKCCSIKNSIKCVPYFIIAGSQKSGTTALSGILSSQLCNYC